MRRHSRAELSRRRKFRPGRAGRAYCERNRSSGHCDASTVFLNKTLTAVRVLAQARQRGDAKYIASVSVAGRRAPTKTALLVAAVCKTLTAVRVFARPPKPDQTRSSENELPTSKLKVASNRPRSLPANIAITATRAQRSSNTFIDHTRLSSWRSWRILPPGRNAVLITANSITRGRELGHPGTAAAMFASRADRRARDERRTCSSSRVPRMDTMGGSPIWSIEACSPRVHSLAIRLSARLFHSPVQSGNLAVPWSFLPAARLRRKAVSLRAPWCFQRPFRPSPPCSAAAGCCLQTGMDIYWGARENPRSSCRSGLFHLDRQPGSSYATFAINAGPIYSPLSFGHRKARKTSACRFWPMLFTPGQKHK